MRAFELGEGGLLVLRGWTPLSVGLHPAVAPLRQCNGRMLAFVPGSALWGVYTIQQTSSKRPAIHLYFEYICWKFARRLLDRVNTLLASWRPCSNCAVSQPEMSIIGLVGPLSCFSFLCLPLSPVCYSFLPPFPYFPSPFSWRFSLET